MIIQNFRNFTHSQLAYGFSGHHVTVQQLDQLAVILQNGTKQSNISELPNLAQSPISRLSPFDRVHPLRWQLCRNSRFSSHSPILASLRRGKISLPFNTGTPFACRIASLQSHPIARRPCRTRTTLDSGLFFCCRCLLPQAPKAGSWGSSLNSGNDTCIRITFGLWLALAHALQFRTGSAAPSPIHSVIPRSIGPYHNTPLFRCRAAASPTHRQIDTHKRGVTLVSLEGHTENQPGSERSKTRTRVPLPWGWRSFPG